MVEVVLTGLGKIADYLVAPIGRQFTYLFCFNSNIKELEAKFEEFQPTRQGVQMGVDRDQRNVRVIAPNVEAWLKSASEVTTEVEGIIQDKAKVKEGCLNGWCPNLKLRYSLSRKAVKKTTVVVDLRKDGVQYTQSSYSPPPPCLETITNRDFIGFESRSLNMEEIFKALKHDEINLIGVCGMGGVGKTTMVNEVAKRAKEDNHFDEVAMAVVGQEPNRDNVQACIANMLDLELGDMSSPVVRAEHLRKRLVHYDKKVLVILDDIWKEFDLQAMGIPLEGANKNFKMLYTSRARDLWHDIRTKKEIPLELLSEDEAWQLFREKAGDSADARDLQPIAKQIVHECGRLPLALVLIGSALSKKSGRNAIKNIWEGMLYRLTCASGTPADDQLYARLQLSYEDLEEGEAKRLFLLCCFFQEDEDIRIEDLARYGYGLSLFDGINEMAKVRRQVFLIVDDLKNRYLLLQSSKEKCVKVHNVVRNMSISIVSKDKCAIVSHGVGSEWPKTVTHEHYTALSVISEKIKEVPEGLAYPNLEFLMLRCHKLEKIPPNFFEGIGKLKVLELTNCQGILTFQPLKNLSTLALEGFCGKLDNVRVIGDLLNLEILSLRNSDIEELPEEIGGLVNLRLLDLTDTDSLNRIPPGVISRLIRLEELYCMDSEFSGWEGEGKEQGGRNANLREFESLSNLNTLWIQIRKDVPIPEPPIFSKLENYRVAIVGKDDDLGFDIDDFCTDEVNVSVKGLKRILAGHASIPMIDLLARSSDGLILVGREGCNDLLREVLFRDGVDGIQQLKVLGVGGHDNLKCLADAMNRVHLPTAILRSEEKNPTTTARPTSAFPILQILYLRELPDLREICRGPVPAGSFGELTSIYVKNCGRLGNLFQLQVVGCLTQLKRLSIKSNDMMEEVFQKERQGDVRDITNRIVFPKLEFLKLAELPSLVGFCRGIDMIEFPQLKEVRLQDMPQLNLLFHNNSNCSSNSEQGFLSLFPHKVSLPNLEVMKLTELENLERLEHGSLSVGSLSKLKEFSVRGCGKLLCVFASQLLPMLRHLEDLFVESCELLEVMFELEGADSNEPNPTILSPLKLIVLRDLPKLNYISKRDPMGFEYIQTLHIYDCSSLKHVFAPTMAKSIPLLCDLRIWKCEMLSRIVAEENGLGESSVEEVEFPQLKRLELGNLPNLVSFFPNVNTTVAQSGDHYHNLVQPQPLFNEKVAIPSLVYLRLFGLKNVRNMFHPSMAGGLVNLQKLLIKDCSTLETVGMEEEVGGHGRILHKTLFPQLIKLVLARLPKLKWFCHFTHPLELPRLRTMDIMFCPSMDAFSLGHVSAPNLSLPGILWNGDLNNAIQSLPKPSYEDLEDEVKGLEDEAKRLFLLSCFFQEDEDIRIEDLARYGYGLSLFDRINDMAKVRHQVLLIVDDLKCRYLLLQSSNEKCVKVHDVVRDMGISIASKDKYAIVSHGAVFEWPKTVTHENEHYTAISVISEKIKEVPEGLAYPNLEFLMLRCHKLEKLLPNFFEGIGKLKVLELKNFNGTLTFQPLKNLTTLVLEGFCGTLDNVRVIGDLLNLEILSFCNSDIEELPEEIGGLVNLRLLDLMNTESLIRIPPGVISCLVCLEELYCMAGKFSDWEGEGKEQGGRNANLREFESLSNLNTLWIQIRKDELIPEPPIFSKLKNYRVAIVDKDDDRGYDLDDTDYDTDDTEVSFKGLKRILVGHASIPIIDLFARSSDGLRLDGSEGCNDLLREVLFRDGVDGIQQLKFLVVCEYDNLKCLADTMNLVHLPSAILRSEEKKPTASAPPTAAFPILQILYLTELPNLREICRGPVPAGSFGELTSIRVEKCGRLGNLFPLSVEGCLTQLKHLSIKSNYMMEEVFRKEQQGDVRDITNRIVFPKLESLELVKLPSLVVFCRGIDLIDFPQLKELRLRDMPQFNLFHSNSNLSSHSEQGFLSLFPHKVTFPRLENLELEGCESLKYVFQPSMAKDLVNLQELIINDCSKMEAVVDREEEIEGGQGRKSADKTLFPRLSKLELRRLQQLKRFCHFKYPLELPLLSQMVIWDCPSMDSFSFGYVRAPNLRLQATSRNGKIWR